MKIWALTCEGGCEDFLRSDALWSGTSHGVPETPDETTIRLDVEKRGQIEQQATMAQALHDLAKLGDLPGAIAQLARIMGGERHQLEEAPVQLCRNGHPNTATAHFCIDCGANMQDAANRKDAAGALAAGPSINDLPKAVDLETLNMNELKEIATSLGVPTTRSKAEQIALIKEAQDE